MARYDADDVYCIPGTAVLKNKAGITNQDLLDEYEGDFTAIRRDSLEKKPLWPQLIGTIAIASDKKISGVGIAELDLGDVPTIANFVLKNALPIMEV